MKPRFAIYALVLVVVILAVVFRHRPVQSPTNVEQPQETVQSTNAPVTDASAASQGTPTVTPTVVSSPAMPKQADPNGIRSPEGFQQYVEGHNVPIDFHGQVIDQDSNALSGVDIKVVVRHWTMPDPAVLLAGTKELRLERVTGADGRFDINGETGDAFDLESIQKDGYEAELTKRGFGSSGGSFNQPVVFKMWNTNIHEQLITGEKKFQIVPDGRPYVIDLSKGTIAESGAGDLKAWVKRPESVTYGQRYDWSCEVDAINGGLLEEPLGTAMYLAPTGGYVSSFQFEQKVGSGWGDSTGAKRFYVTLNNGHEYGSIAIELYAYYNNQTPGLIRLSYAINPSGSRILR